MWVCTDPEAVGLHDQLTYRRTQAEAREAAKAEAEKETKRAERRQVIANNKSWRSSETVRRDWLAKFVTRKTPPKDAEALIAEAVLTGHHSLSKAMEHGHPMLFTLLGIRPRQATTARAKRCKISWPSSTHPRPQRCSP